MMVSRFAGAVVGACMAMAIAASVARADDTLIDCDATGVVPPSAAGSHAIKEEAPAAVSSATGWSGSVALTLTVGADGNAGDVRVGKSSGVASVDNAIAEAVRDHWRYAPATRDGKPITCRWKTSVLWGRKPAPAIWKVDTTVLRISASDYPADILAKKEEGTVGLLVFIDDDDKKAVRAKVMRPSRFSDLDAASVDFVTHRAHLTPAQINGSPAKTIVYLNLQWSIAPASASAQIGDHPATSMLMMSEQSLLCSGSIWDPGEFDKRGAILFYRDESQPSSSQLPGIKLLADDLANAIKAGATSVQLRAYAGDAWNQSSDQCKISLDRGNAIRQLLVDNGVEENKISVFAMGGITDDGDPDRVDIYVPTK